MVKSIHLFGGSGFIGSNTIRELQTDYQIQNIDKKNSPLCATSILDICESQKFQEIPVTASGWVIHLAAEHADNVSPISLYYDVNVQGTGHILKWMRENNINKILFTSTVAVYGLNKENPDENFPTDPFNHYGKSKLQAEDLLRAWYQEDPENRTLVILRPTVVFGPKNRGNVYNLLQQVLSGRFMMIGSGNNKKSMAYVGNVVSFIRYILQQANDPGYHVFNYADKPDLTTSQLLEIISTSCNKKASSVKIPYAVGFLAGKAFDVLSAITGKKFSISSIRIKKFCSTTQFSSERVQSTDFKPPYTLQEGLKTTIESLL